jgi:membrane protein DedA with SNARE-associated domain
MNATDLSTTLLLYITTYGAGALGGLVLLAALGVPLPSTLLVLASGALIQQGVLDLPATVLLAFGGAVLGDTLSYGLGRVLRRPLRARFGQTAAWGRAAAYFDQRGAPAIYLTRCLLTVLALPINWIAGSSSYPAGRFVRAAAAGELTWVVGYGSLGYLLGSQWEAAGTALSAYSGVALGLLILAGIWWARRRLA